jgi:hypothetical protein
VAIRGRRDGTLSSRQGCPSCGRPASMSDLAAATWRGLWHHNRTDASCCSDPHSRGRPSRSRVSTSKAAVGSAALGAETSPSCMAAFVTRRALPKAAAGRGKPPTVGAADHRRRYRAIGSRQSRERPVLTRATCRSSTNRAGRQTGTSGARSRTRPPFGAGLRRSSHGDAPCSTRSVASRSTICPARRSIRSRSPRSCARRRPSK